ncbi:FliI/YscN family ATPase [Pseudomonas gorinensis]
MSQDLQDRLDAWQARQVSHLASFAPVAVRGRIQRVNGMLLQCRLPQARIGDLCKVDKYGDDSMLAEIIGFDHQDAVLSALGNLEGVQVGASVQRLGVPHRVRVGHELLGQVLDGFGRPIAGEGPGAFVDDADTKDATTVLCEAPLPTERPRIHQALATGVRSIDGLLTLGEGQRVGLFAGAGCGKTTLLAEIARNVECDVIVFGLIGERGRELREFLDHELDDQLRAKAVLVCATSDRSSMERARAAFTATALAEGFRRKGQRVLLLIDSLTRFARAQREIGLAAGEPLGRGGLPPSVYSLLPRLVERAGLTREGVITAIYTVLIEQDSMSDPVADEVRSLLDGHIVLSRKLAERGHYPAVDVLASLSRILSNVAEPSHIQAGTALRRLLSAYQQIELMLKLGEYQAGNDALTDMAVDSRQAVDGFLRQDLREPSPLASTLQKLSELTAYVPF